MNRAQRRGNLRRREHNTMRAMVKARWVHDADNELKRERERQRDMWIACVACNAAFHIGPKRIGKFTDALEEVATEWKRMAADADEEYADEKLRQEVERISRESIPELFRVGEKEGKQ